MTRMRALVACVLATAVGATAAAGIAGGVVAAPAATPATPAITGLETVLLVADQDAALQWYVEKLGFEKKIDQQFGPGMRWLTMVPKGQTHPEIILQKAAAGQEGQVGKSLGWVFETADCKQAYEAWSARGVKFAGPPDVQAWGTQARFEDLYGNHFTLVSGPQR